LIDHGATLFMHHTPGWPDDPAKPTAPFALIKSHVLVHKASRLREVDVEMAARLGPDVIAAIVSQIPGEWLDVQREDYARYLTARLRAPRVFVEEAAGGR
jgi:hypothetical protein